MGRGPVDVILQSCDCAQMIFGIVRKALWESIGLGHHFPHDDHHQLEVQKSTIFRQTGVVNWKHPSTIKFGNLGFYRFDGDCPIRRDTWVKPKR